MISGGRVFVTDAAVLNPGYHVVHASGISFGLMFSRWAILCRIDGGGSTISFSYALYVTSARLSFLAIPRSVKPALLRASIIHSPRDRLASSDRFSIGFMPAPQDVGVMSPREFYLLSIHAYPLPFK